MDSPSDLWPETRFGGSLELLTYNNLILWLFEHTAIDSALVMYYLKNRESQCNERRSWEDESSIANWLCKTH